MIALDTGCAAGVIESPRLLLRQLEDGDATFIRELLNTPAFLQHIGDRGVRDLEGARAYLAHGPQKSYAENGFGLFLVARRADQAAVGICGLLKRAHLAHPDIGFAYLPQYCAQGYGFEAARATLDWGADALGIKRVLAIVAPGNGASIALLRKLRFEYERRLAPDDGKNAAMVYALGVS